MEEESISRAAAAGEIVEAIETFRETLALLSEAIQDLEAVDAAKTPAPDERMEAIHQLTAVSQQMNTAATQLHATFAAWKDAMETQQHAATAGAQLLKDIFAEDE
ncbi:MAG: hypothetical protein ACYDBB_21915 [Armatimonadota bacterium]